MKFNIMLLKKDIKNYFDSFGNTYIKEYLNVLEKEAQGAIRYFYTTYNPTFYDREFYFLNNSLNKIEDLKKKTYKRGVLDLLADVRFSGYDIYEDLNKDDVNIRMENWYGHRDNAPSTSPSPLQILMERCDAKIPHNKAVGKAKQVAGSKTYTCLKK